MKAINQRSNYNILCDVWREIEKPKTEVNPASTEFVEFMKKFIKQSRDEGFSGYNKFLQRFLILKFTDQPTNTRELIENINRVLP